MAFRRKLEGETLPEKVVIVTGPTLGTILGFIALGAALGAAAALYFKNGSAMSGDSDGLAEGAGGQRMNSLVERLNSLQARIKSLASRTRETVSHASEVLGPVLHEAVNEAKRTAHDAEEELQAEINKPRPTTATEDQDDTIPEAEKAKGAGDPAI